jgi:hypothetical protein
MVRIGRLLSRIAPGDSEAFDTQVLEAPPQTLSPGCREGTACRLTDNPPLNDGDASSSCWKLALGQARTIPGNHEMWH